MRKSLLIMFLLFTVGMTANAQKFALIDMEYILKNIPAYQSATNELNQASKQWQSEVEKLGKEAKSLYDSYQASIKTLSEAQKSTHKYWYLFPASADILIPDRDVYMHNLRIHKE